MTSLAIRKINTYSPVQKILVVMFAVLGVACLRLVYAPHSLAVSIAEYSTSAVQTVQPSGITAGPDGALWFAALAGGQLGRSTTAGQVTQLPIGGRFTSTTHIVTGSDGNLWFTYNGVAGLVGMMTPVGVERDVTLPESDLLPVSITAGPDGALWLTAQYSDRGNGLGLIVRLTTAGVATEYPLPNVSGDVNFFPGVDKITTGADGNLWFTEFNANKIGKITPAGVITEYALSGSNAGLNGITSGPDGNLWFSEGAANKIGRITPKGTVTTFNVPGGHSPQAITAQAGAIWFAANNTTSNVSYIGRFGLILHLFSEYKVPTSSAGVNNMTAGPDGNIWFTESSQDKVGKVNPRFLLIGDVDLINLLLEFS